MLWCPTMGVRGAACEAAAGPITRSQKTAGGMGARI